MVALSSMRTVREIVVRQVSEGAEAVRRDLDGLAQAQSRVAAASQQTATTTEQASRRQLSAAAAYDKVRVSVDAAYKAQQQFERASGRVDRAFNQGVITAAERQQTIDLARQRYLPEATGNDNDPARRGLSSYQRRDLMYQGGDVVASLGSGAGLGTVALQQGPQVLQSLASGEGGLRQGLKDLGASALGLVTPFTVAAAAVTGIGAAFIYAGTQAARDQDILEKATKGIGAATGATVSQLDTLAKSNAEAGKVSASTAREFVAAYASLGTIGLPVIGDLTRVTSEYARVTGQDGAAAATELGRAVSEGGSALDAVAAKIGGLDDRTRQFIQTQIEQGDRSGAQATAAEYLKSTIDANASSTTGWAAAWNTATAAANGYWEAAKRIAGVRLGVIPEGAADALSRINRQIELSEKEASGKVFSFGQTPGTARTRIEELQAERDRIRAAQVEEDRRNEARAAEERADRRSREAGALAQASDPNSARLSQLRNEQTTFRDALSDPMARSRLADFDQVEREYNARTRAIDTLTDSSGRLIDRQEMARRSDQLRLDATKATTDAAKAEVAERQKAFDLIGKTITGSDAREQIARARELSLASSASKAGGGGGGSSSEARDEYDRALKSQEDRIRRGEQEATTFGMGAAAVARYRTETELLTAAKRAEREITPLLTAQISEYADKAAAAAERQEKLRESMRTMDNIRGTGREVFGGIFADLGKSASAADIFSNALGRIQSRIADMAANSLTDALFGARGSSSSGILRGLFSGGGTGGASSPGLSDFFSGSFFPSFADGGIMTSAGKVPLNAYATGGIANSPQMALFGEGRTPEAYVPLPDGKRIPVAMEAPANGNGPAAPMIIEGDKVTVQVASTGASPQEIAAAFARNNEQRDRSLAERLAMSQRRFA